METVSENIGKRKRGRPQAFSEIELRGAKSISENTQTQRHLQNVGYSFHALADLIDDPRFTWLCNEKAMLRGEPHSWRPTILSELGRIDDPDAMKAVALRICELKPRAHDAVTMIRRWRLGKVQQGSILQLTQELTETIDNYRLRYPSITWKQARGALVNAIEVVDDIIEDGPKEEAA